MGGWKHTAPILKYVNPDAEYTGGVDNAARSGLEKTGLQSPPLVIRFGAFGDMILTTPLLRALAIRHQQPCDVLGRGDFVPNIFKHLPFVSAVRVIDSKKTPYFLNPQKWELVRWLHHRPPGLIYMVESDAISHRILHRAGVTPTATELHINRRINEHVVDHMARLAGFVDHQGDVLPDYPRGTELRVSPEEEADLDRWLQSTGCADAPIVMLQPGYRKYKNPLRRIQKGKFWQERRWIRVIQGILDIRPEVRIFITGSPDEISLSQRLERQCNSKKVRSIAGQMNVRRLFALLHRAHSMLSVDTGAAHAAAALKCPLIVLFGKTDPRVNRPVSQDSPVIVLTGPENAPIEDDEDGWRRHHSMKSISVETVLSAWNSLLKSPETTTP